MLCAIVSLWTAVSTWEVGHMLNGRWFRACLLCLLFSASLVAAAQSRNDEGKPAPRFTAKTLSGERFSNDSIKGKVVLLEFWATWCKYCQNEEGYLDQLDKEFGPQGFVTLAIDVGEDKSTVKKYLQRNARSVRIVLTGDTNLAAMFAANSYPIYVLIGRDGNIVAEQRGAGGERALRRMLSRAGLEAKDDAAN